MGDKDESVIEFYGHSYCLFAIMHIHRHSGEVSLVKGFRLGVFTKRQYIIVVLFINISVFQHYQ